MDEIAAPVRSDKVLQVPCPTCLSSIGVQCVGVRGRHRRSCHRARFDDVPANPKRRQSISPKLRFEIFKRDQFTCQYCGATPPKAILHLEHITAVANGGDNAETNLTTACSICNGGKGTVPLDIVPASLAERADLVAESEAQLAGYAEVLNAQKARLERDCWTVIVTLYGREQTSHARFNTALRFVRELGVHSVNQAAEIAIARDLAEDDEWRYFCGICWKRIKGTAL